MWCVVFTQHTLWPLSGLKWDRPDLEQRENAISFAVSTHSFTFFYIRVGVVNPLSFVPDYFGPHFPPNSFQFIVIH
jgi:hypothetical protein